MTIHPLAPIRRMFFVQNGGTPKTSVPEYWGGDLAWVTPEDLGKNEGRFIHSSRRTVTSRGVQASNAELVPAGSIVMSTRAPIGYTAIAGLPLATNQGCKTLVPNREIDSRFFEYELSVRTSDLNVLGTGATFMELSTDALASFRVPVPPLASQRRIADFLDRETERIDALIDKKRRLIDLLEEKRTATITHAVTKGLNPVVPMKPSGIPWTGEIPKHWEYGRLKHSMLSLIDTEHKTVHFVDDGHYPVVRTSDVRSGRLLLDQAKRTDEAGYREWTRRRKPQPGGVMLAREAPAGEACLVPVQPPVCLGQRMVLITPDSARLLAEYLVYYIYSDPVQISIELASQGSTVTHLNMADIPELPLALPDVQEQATIVRYLDDQTSTLDDLSKTIETQLTLLAEYREALITAAVTGEIDVETFDNDEHMEEATA